ncbi:sporulation protein [Patescibacteria group bacterium]
MCYNSFITKTLLWVFSKLGASVGIGSTKLTMNLSPLEVPQGGKVTGSILLVGGQVEQNVNAVKAQLVRLWIEEEEVRVDDDGGSHYETRRVTRHDVVQDNVVSSSFIIKPEEQKQFPVEIEIPLHANINDDDNWWEAWGVAEIGKGKDSKQGVKLAILPSAMMTQFQVIVTSQLQWGFKDIRPAGSDGQVQMNYNPPAELGQMLDEIRCVLRNSSGQLYLNLVLDFKAKKFGDYFKALVGKDDKAASLAFSEADLQNNQAAIVDTVKQKLQQLTNQVEE